MEFLDSLIKPVLTGLLTFLIYYFLRPKKSENNKELNFDFDKLTVKYKKVDAKGTVVFLVTWILLSIAFGYALNSSYLLLVSESSFSYFSPASPFIFYISAFFLSVVPSAALYVRYLERMPNFDWDEFRFYYEIKYKIAFDKGSKYVGGSMFFIGLIALVLGLDTYTYKSQDKFVFNSYFGLENTYNCNDLEKIVYYENIEAPNGKVKPEESYRIFFKDGNNWFTRSNGFYEEQDFDFVEDFAEACGVEILEEESTRAY